MSEQSWTECGKTVMRYLHPLSLIEEVADTIWPMAQVHLAKLSDDAFELADKLFNLTGVIAIHLSATRLSWTTFFQVMLGLGIVKRTLLKRREQMNRFIDQVEHTSPVDATEPKYDQLRCDVDKVEEFCVQNKKPSLDWLNRIILALWLNFRALARHRFLFTLWPKYKKMLEGTALGNLQIHDFNIGDKPFRILNIEVISHSRTDLVVDVDVAYDGSANITITYSQESLNISIPVTLQKFSLSNIKVRVVLKGLHSRIPFVGGIQLFFLEVPNFNWETADAAKVIELPGLDTILKTAIENQIVKRFVLPNRLSLPIRVPDNIVKKIERLGLDVVQGDECITALPMPVGVLSVTCVKAESLRATDLGFQHWKTSNNLNPFNIKTFSCTELLPKKCSGDPYVRISIGRARHSSPPVRQSSNPVWNYTEDFPIEYYEKAVVKVEIFDADVNIAGISSDDALGRITEKIKRIKDKKDRGEGDIEGWYNCELYQGRAFLRFHWINLTSQVPVGFDTAFSVSGVLCLLIGTIRSEEKIRAACSLEMVEGNEIASQVSLDAISNNVSWAFNEGKIFRIKNLKEKNNHLIIKIRDNKSWKWIGERKFKMRRLLENPLHGYCKFPNPFSSAKPVALSLTTRILYDERSL